MERIFLINENYKPVTINNLIAKMYQMVSKWLQTTLESISLQKSVTLGQKTYIFFVVHFCLQANEEVMLIALHPLATLLMTS